MENGDLPKLSQEDLLRIENISLKMQNLSFQQKLLQKDLIDCGRQQSELANEWKKLVGEVAEKYGMDIEKCSVGPDGTMMPRPVPKPGSP